jgi:membrane-anchored glycerophosphoryl diester phosphodiesterase (GDPDase)
MKEIKLGLIFGFIGVAVYLIINFGPLLLGVLSNSNELKAMANINLSFNLIRIGIYFAGGFVVGLVISLFKKENTQELKTIK